MAESARGASAGAAPSHPRGGRLGDHRCGAARPRRRGVSSGRSRCAGCSPRPASRRELRIGVARRRTGRDQGARLDRVRRPELELGRAPTGYNVLRPRAGGTVSGIAALFARDGAPADAALLARLIAAQRFRGPDGQGSWVRGSVGLGHTLHKTTLEAEREVSPTSLDDRLFITADARIDARDELCARLARPRPRAPGRPAGPRAGAARLRRMGRRLLASTSSAISASRSGTRSRRQLFCAVDALGTRPFYYADRGGLVRREQQPRLRAPSPRGPRRAGRTRGRRLHTPRRLRGSRHHHLRGHRAHSAGAFPGRGGGRLAPDALLRRGLDPIEARVARPDDCVDEFRELLGRAVRDRLRTPRWPST